MTDYKLGKFLVQKDFQKTGNFQKTDKTENFFSENRKTSSPVPTFQKSNLKTFFHSNLQCLKVVTQVSNRHPEHFGSYHKLKCEKLFFSSKT